MSLSSSKIRKTATPKPNTANKVVGVTPIVNTKYYIDGLETNGREFWEHFTEECCDDITTYEVKFSSSIGIITDAIFYNDRHECGLISEKRGYVL